MQAGRARCAKQPIPKTGSKSNDTGQLALGNPKANRSLKPTGVCQEIARRVFSTGTNRQHEEDRGLGERRQNSLRLGLLHSAVYGFSATAASGVATWKLKLCSRYSRTTSPSCES